MRPVNSWTTRRAGFSFVEIVIAVAILAACLVPVLSFSSSSVRSTSANRQELLARQIAMDLMERYKNSSLAELRTLPAPETADPAPGTDHPAIQKDPLLQSRKDQFDRLKKGNDERINAFQAFEGEVRSIQIARAVYFDQDRFGTGKHLLRCVVTWTGGGNARRKVEIEKLVVRKAPAA